MNNNNKKETWLKKKKNKKNLHLGFANSLARTRRGPNDLQTMRSTFAQVIAFFAWYRKGTEWSLLGPALPKGVLTSRAGAEAHCFISNL